MNTMGNRVFVFLVAAFLGGVFLDRAGWLPGSQPNPGSTFAPFWETWQLIDEHYVDRSAVKPKHMTEGAIRGLLNSLGDTGHTTYLTAEEFALAERNLQGKLHGIGARLTLRRGQPTVVMAYPNSPAQKGGLLTGDVLLAVDGKSVKGLSLDKIVLMVRGQPGTTVQLRVLRNGHEEKNLRIQRGEVTVPLVTRHMLPGSPIAHVAIEAFGPNADVQLRQALYDARNQGAKGLVLDLRANPGGLKEQVVAITSEFVQTGHVFLEEDAKGNRTAVPVVGNSQATDMPLCLLIDEGTASAAEIFAGAIQDHHRGKLVGTRTFGTGTILEPFRLTDGSVVLLAVREWLTPAGRNVWHKGITPDIEVRLPHDAPMVLPEMESAWTAADLAKTADRQLQKAFEIVKGQIQH